MKKIINQTENIVLEMCNGIVLSNPELTWDKKYKVIHKKQINPDKVSLISGGGSGHEPAHAGFVGKGMLDGAICGDVFASPSQIQVYQGIKATKSKKGTLLIIKNYSGDMMNFKNAAHLAALENMKMDYVKVHDDVAVEDSLYTVGRRGVAGTVFVHKIAGAAAEKGLELEEVKRLAQKAADNVGSIGFALTSCTVPAKGTPTFNLQEDEIEYGVGIHGEPGIQRQSLASAQDMADKMVDALVKDLNLTHQEVAVLINGFGATPLMELYVLNNCVIKALQARKIPHYRILVGNYMTSIDMAGASITLLKLDEELKAYLDAPCATAGLTISGAITPNPYGDILLENQETKAASFKVTTKDSQRIITGDKFSLENMVYLVDLMSQVIIDNEIPFCDLDSHAGDGDFGMSVAKGFRQVKREWDNIVQAQDIGEFLQACARVIMEYCGGASGPIWGFAFFSAGVVTLGKKELSTAEFAQMLQAAVKGIQDTGERSFGRGAKVGDKTLMDALIPCADTWTQGATSGQSFAALMEQGAKAAVAGSAKTAEFAARMGRAENAGQRSIGYPDAGAHALGVIFTAIAEAMA